MENRRNYYRILHVQPGAPVDIIRASYRTLMQRLRAHPDLGGDHWNAALINEAYAVLTDAAKRAEYDREFRSRVVDARSDAMTAATPAAERVAEATETDGRCLFCKTPHRSRPRLRTSAACTVCGSPLQRAAPRSMSSGGKRAIDRVPRNHPLQLHTRWPPAAAVLAHCRDVSPNGISFVTQELLTHGAIIKLDSPMCRAVIRVANIRADADENPGAWLVGAEFLSVIFARSRGAFLSTET